MVARVRRILNDAPFADVTTNAITTTSQTTFTVADGTIYDNGVTLEFDGGEQVIITAVATNTLHVIRGYNDTDPSTYASGATITRDPVFQYAQILEAIGDTIRSMLWPYVWKQIEADDGGNIIITPNGNTRWYELPEECIYLSQVVQLVGSTNPWPFVYGTTENTYPVAIRRHMPTSLVATGVALYIPYRYNTTNDIEVTALGRITDDIEDDSGDAYIDLEDGALAEAVVDYAVARLLGSSDVSRTTQQDIQMGDQTVASGSRSRLAAYWEAQALEKRRDWEVYLRDTLPKMEPRGRHNNLVMRPRRV
jgi:hypothetical protein